MKFFLSIILATLPIFSFSQEKKPQKVKIENADELEGGIHNGQEIRKLRGNVIFSQDGATMYCDSAYQYVKTNSIDAFGKVKILQGDSMTITGNFLTYNGNTKIAKMQKNVVMKDKTMTLYTNFLDYNMKTSTGYYYQGGKIVDKETTLTSDKGSYHSPSKTLFFKDSVHLIDKEYLVWCDTLHYNTISKKATFLGPTKINSDGTQLFAKKGMYNSTTGESHFENKATIIDSNYTLTGDSIHYHQNLKKGYAQGNVELFLAKDTIFIYGEIGHSDEIKGVSKVYGKGTLMKSLMEKDTVYLTSDTLMALSDTAGNIEKLIAWNNVQLFKSDLQGKCDSLAYNYVDSTISLFISPILWSDGSQMTGNFIKVQLNTGTIDKLFIDENSFIVSEDVFKNHNQIKGKNMIAKFKDGKIDNLDVIGNGQSVYFVLEEDSIFTGMNKTVCTNMKFKFDSNEVKKIKFLTNPEAKLIPPKELKDPDKFLPGYQWVIEKQPNLQKMLLFEHPPESPLLEVPEESELPENSSNNEEQDLVNREDD